LSGSDNITGKSKGRNSPARKRIGLVGRRKLEASGPSLEHHEEIGIRMLSERKGISEERSSVCGKDR